MLKTGFRRIRCSRRRPWCSLAQLTTDRNFSNSEFVVPYVRCPVWGSASAAPSMTQTTTNFFPTSIPAQRSIAARIMVCSFQPEKVDVSTKKLLRGVKGTNRGFLHIGQISLYPEVSPPIRKRILRLAPAG